MRRSRLCPIVACGVPHGCDYVLSVCEVIDRYIRSVSEDGVASYRFKASIRTDVYLLKDGVARPIVSEGGAVRSSKEKVSVGQGSVIGFFTDQERAIDKCAVVLQVTCIPAT